MRFSCVIISLVFFTSSKNINLNWPSSCIARLRRHHLSEKGLNVTTKWRKALCKLGDSSWDACAMPRLMNQDHLLYVIVRSFAISSMCLEINLLWLFIYSYMFILQIFYVYFAIFLCLWKTIEEKRRCLVGKYFNFGSWSFSRIHIQMPNNSGEGCDTFRLPFTP